LWAQLRAEGLIRSDAPLTPGDRDQNRDEELSV
jgi:hypothetical protein